MTADGEEGFFLRSCRLALLSACPPACLPPSAADINEAKGKELKVVTRTCVQEGMSSVIKNVAVAGATGNTGPTVIQTLVASGFEVTALTRSTANAKLRLGPDVKIVEVDYLSHDSLVSALRGNDAVVVCGVGMYASALTRALPHLVDIYFGADICESFNSGCPSRPISSTRPLRRVCHASFPPTLRAT